MKKQGLLIAFILAIITIKSNAQQIVAFKNVNLITMTSELVLESQTVLTKGDRIIHIGSVTEVKIPTGAKIIDGTGKFLMPGLSDMHMHPEEFTDLVHPLNLYLANGVTTIRTMNAEGGANFILRWRNEINKGNRIGPKIYSSGITYNINCDKKNYDFMLAEERRLGFDVLKLYGGLSKKSFNNLMDIAKENKMYTAGHIPFPLGLDGVIEAGLDEIAHIEEIIFNELFDIDRSKKQESDMGWYVDFAMTVFEKYKTKEGYDIKKLLADSDETLNDIVRRLKESKIPVHTTLAVDDVIIRKILHPKEFMKSNDWNYFTNNYKKTYISGNEKHQQQFRMIGDIASKIFAKNSVLMSKMNNAEQFALVKFALDSALCSKMNKAGCTLIFGTDAAISMGVLSGMSIHHEFEMLIKCGLTPYQALLTSTANASKVVKAMNGIDDFGTIEKNKRADLILLDKNPLKDITNLKSLVGTMVAGNWLNKKSLNEKIKIKKKNIPRSGRMVLMKTIEKNGIGAAIDKYWKAKNTKGNENRLNVDEAEINALGYDLIGKGLLKEAAAILKLNTMEYPLGWNVWDSYAEVHANLGDIKTAKDLYKRAILFNPNSPLPKKALADLDDINKKWTGTTDQKIYGLMTVWSEIKFGSPYKEKLRTLNWDNKVQEYIPRVIAAKNLDDYYKVLMEFAALVNDSHTSVLPPWGYFKPGYDIPPVEIQVINDKFYIARIGITDELESQNIVAGIEILEVENTPIQTYFKDNVLKYYTAGSKHANDAMLALFILYGSEKEKVNLKIKDLNGINRNVSLSRDSKNSDGSPFMYKFVSNFMVASTIKTKWMKNNILYVNIPNFEKNQVADDFQSMIDTLEVAKVKGMILDIRHNTGGSSRNSNKVVSCLIDKPVSSPLMHFPHYIAAYKAWGKNEVWDVENSTINPRSGKKYLGPVVVLIGALSSSSSEDLAIELKTAKRAKLMGQISEGGAGNTLKFKLPGGGSLKLGTFKATYPDETEYIGIGIKPDIEIYPTVQDIIENRDRVLQKAVDVLK